MAKPVKKSPLKKALKKPGQKKKLAPKKKSAKKSPKKIVKTKKKPAAKRKSNGSVDLECFLTTACARHMQLGDDCTELQTLRAFRDGYMMSKVEGRRLVKEYYKSAPGIVKAIETDIKNQEVYAYIFSEITLACNYILNKRMPNAQSVYENMVNALKKKYNKTKL